MASAPAPAEDLLEECTEVARIALASAGCNRAVWLAAFALDGRIGRMVLGATEPLLGQMRLAWWRDQLAVPGSARPQGDPLLDLIGAEWAGHERALSDLVDGWEALLGERPLSELAMQRFFDGRGSLGSGVAQRLLQSESAQPAAEASRLWARADLAAYAGDASEREHALSVTASLPRLQRELRPLSVMGGLAGRSLRRGGVPMVGDRFSPLVALRLGLFGR